MTSLERAALLVMDFQVAILRDSPLAPTEDAALALLDAAVDGAAAAVRGARARGVPVIHVRHAYRPGHVDAPPNLPLAQYMKRVGALVDGDPGADFDERVRPAADELVITKRSISALAGTELDPLLRSRGIDTLILAGVVTHFVIEGTARHAADLGYRVVVLTDACASGDLARHESSLKNLGPLSMTKTTAELLG